MNRAQQVFILFIAVIALNACSTTKNLPKNETLYTGSSVQIKDNNASKREKKVLKKDLQGSILPKPNSKFLGIPLKLAIYNIGGDTAKKKGLNSWLRRKFGEAPVLGSELDLDKNKKLLTNILENRGFFYPSIEAERKIKGKKSSGRFDVTTGPQYKIRNVYFPTDTTQIGRDIRAQESETLLKPDLPYNLDLIKGERDRIDRRLKEIGYFYFKSDYILALVDSSIGDHKVDILLKPKDEIPGDAAEVYKIGNVFIYPRYNLLNRNASMKTSDTMSLARAMTNRRRRRMRNDSLFYERYYIMGNTRAYKPYVFTQAMQFSPGDLYNRTDHNMALNRLVNMGTFKFVKNEFVPSAPGVLNTYYYLTPYPKKTLQSELGTYTKNDGRVGSQLSISWKNRNTLRGAELLTIRATGGFETQSGGGVKRPNIYQLGFEPRITIPRFVIPFFNVKSSSFFVPHTTMYVGYDLLTRMNLYLLHSFRAGYGYEWKEDVRKDHQLYPINITRVITDTLAPDTNTARYNYTNLVFNGLIFGPTYNFTYNSRGDGPPNRNDIYFNGLADLSGNIVGLIQGADFDKSPKTLFGTNYAQYVKLQTDFRYYMNYGANPNSIWANRLIIGMGMPYGNSKHLPNIKQFYSGGNSSLRGFASRLVGPGAFADTRDKFLETSGDLKLEINTEVRAQLYNFVHGAVFVDAGNVWLSRADTLFPEGEFKADKFLQQLAVDAGVGLRLDFQIFLVRLDVATPIRRAWEGSDKRQQYSDALDNINKDKNWFKQNVVFNLGIGYPF